MANPQTTTAFCLKASEDRELSVNLGISWGQRELGKQGWWLKSAEKEAQT